MTPHCPFLPHPYSLQRALPSHLLTVGCQRLWPSFSLAMCAQGRKKMGRESLDCPTLIPENQIAAAPAEINGNWQENLLFLQS